MPNNFSPETRLADITAGQFEEVLTRSLTKSAAVMKIISLRCKYEGGETISVERELEKLGISLFPKP